MEMLCVIKDAFLEYMVRAARKRAVKATVSSPGPRPAISSMGCIIKDFLHSIFNDRCTVPRGICVLAIVYDDLSNQSGRVFLYNV